MFGESPQLSLSPNLITVSGVDSMCPPWPVDGGWSGCGRNSKRSFRTAAPWSGSMLPNGSGNCGRFSPNTTLTPTGSIRRRIRTESTGTTHGRGRGARPDQELCPRGDRAGDGGLGSQRAVAGCVQHRELRSGDDQRKFHHLLRGFHLLFQAHSVTGFALASSGPTPPTPTPTRQAGVEPWRPESYR